MNSKRIKEIQKGTAYPESVSVKQALCQVWNECAQEYTAILHEVVLKYSDAEKWDGRFMELAEFIASWSKDPSTKVGAVIVDSRHRIVSVGFNGYPQNIPDNDLHIRENKYAKIIHAEKNAILFAQRDLTDCTIYVWPMAPCSQCASAIIQSGITRVVTIPESDEQHERWGEKIKFTLEMLRSANVEIEKL